MNLRAESLTEVKRYLPEQYAEIRALMKGLDDVQNDEEIPCYRTLALKMLRFDDPSDRLKMKKYQQMEKRVPKIKRYRSQLAPNHFRPCLSDKDGKKKIAIDDLINIIEQQSRTTPLEVLEKYDNSTEFMIDYFALHIKSAFDVDYLKLNKITCQPLANHTCRRTFRGIWEYQGIDIKVPLKYPLQQCQDVDNQQKIPHALQGEIAGLDNKFRISLDSAGTNKSIRLMCRLEDDTLPCVPPIFIDIPEKYPLSSPNCTLMQHDYSGTPLLTFVRIILSNYISNLPKYYTVTYLLNTWERSVRRAVNYPNDFQGDSFSMVYTMCIQQQQLTD